MVFTGVVCRMYHLYSTKPFMLGLWEVYMLVWLESLFIGSYVYHLDVIAGAQLCYKSSEIIQSACTYYSPFIIHTI